MVLSRKFLTVFALVALLVAAMAGTAFADKGDLSGTIAVSTDVKVENNINITTDSISNSLLRQ